MEAVHNDFREHIPIPIWLLDMLIRYAWIKQYRIKRTEETQRDFMNF